MHYSSRKLQAKFKKCARKRGEMSHFLQISRSELARHRQKAILDGSMKICPYHHDGSHLKPGRRAPPTAAELRQVRLNQMMESEPQSSSSQTSVIPSIPSTSETGEEFNREEVVSEVILLPQPIGADDDGNASKDQAKSSEVELEKLERPRKNKADQREQIRKTERRMTASKPYDNGNKTIAPVSNDLEDFEEWLLTKQQTS